jgi:cation transport regulator ChaC
MPAPIIHYFAYGSNLDDAQMRHRCPDHEVVGPAKLEGYRLSFHGNSDRWRGAVATVSPAVDHVVWGVLFLLSDDDLRSLDEYEGFQGATHASTLYVREQVRVRTAIGVEVPALTYLMRPHAEGKPSRLYLGTITNGAAHHGLPREYVARLERTPTAD